MFSGIIGFFLAITFWQWVLVVMHLLLASSEKDKFKTKREFWTWMIPGVGVYRAVRWLVYRIKSELDSLR